MELKIILILLVIGALGISIGASLALVGAILYDGYWALFAIFCYLMTPVPAVLSRLFSRGGSDGFGTEDDKTPAIEHFGAFLTAFMATVGLGVLIILAHANAISWKTFAFEISGGAVILLTLLTVGGLFVKFKNSDNDF